MAAGQPPSHRLVMKSKETEKSVQIGAAWPAKFQGAWNLSFGNRDPKVVVEGIVLSIDGKKMTVKPDAIYLNLYKNEPKKAEGSDDAPEDEEEDSDDDLAF